MRWSSNSQGPHRIKYLKNASKCHLQRPQTATHRTWWIHCHSCCHTTTVHLHQRPCIAVSPPPDRRTSTLLCKFHCYGWWVYLNKRGPNLKKVKATRQKMHWLCHLWGIWLSQNSWRAITERALMNSHAKLMIHWSPNVRWISHNEICS